MTATPRAYFKQSQLHTKEKPGNCWATCLANLLGLEAIPELDIYAEDWWAQSQAIAESVGCQLVEFQWGGCRVPDGMLCIASGEGPGRDWNGKKLNHAVLAVLHESKDGYRVTLEHDPHPRNEGLVTFEYITIALKK